MQEDGLDSSILVVKEAMAKHDIVITTGGVSVGDFDYLPQIYEALNAEVLFNKIAMRPGSVTTVAVANETYLFGLSGNPSACYTGFELYVKPAVLHMMGANAIYPQVIQATLMEDFKKANPFTRFIRATATLNGKEMTVVPSGFNKSGAVVAIAHSNAMIMLPGGTRGYSQGHTVNVILTELQIGGYKNAGKTTLMSHTIQFLKSHLLTVATVKHHGFNQLVNQEADITLQNDQVDHMKHFNAGADQSIVQGKSYQQSVTRKENQSLEEIISESVTIDCDVILVEGFKSARFDKVVVYQDEKERQSLSHLTNVKYYVNLAETDALTLYNQWLFHYFKIEGMH